jgi:phosphotransacetylase
MTGGQQTDSTFPHGMTAGQRTDSTSFLQGMTPEQAHQQLTQDLNVFGTTMVKAGDASGMVSGSIHTTANTVRPALQIIKVNAQRSPLDASAIAASWEKKRSHYQ